MPPCEPINGRKISQGENVETLTGAELVVVVQDGITKKTTIQKLASLGVQTYAWPLADETGAITIGVKYVTEPAPYNLTLVEIIAALRIAGSGSPILFDILKETAVNSNSFATIFSTKPAVDAGQYVSLTSAIPPVFSDTDWQKGTRLQLSIDTLDSGTAARDRKSVV